MSKLYKGRYLIALYDENDNLIDVGCLPSQLKLYKNRPQSFYEQKSRGDSLFKNCKVYLIDCLEKHDDIFKEEDEIFLKEYMETEDRIMEIAKLCGVSRRTVYRWRAKGLLKGF